MVAWDRVTRADVLRVVEEYDRLGAEGFFSARGFGPARSYELVIGSRRYPSKAILGAAYEVATGQRLGSGDFEGGKGGAVSVLGRLGFEVEAIQRNGTLADRLAIPPSGRWGHVCRHPQGYAPEPPFGAPALIVLAVPSRAYSRAICARLSAAACSPT